MKYIQLSILIVTVLFSSCTKKQAQKIVVASPDSSIEIQFILSEKGEPTYWVNYKKDKVIKPSTLGFNLKELPSLMEGFEIVNSTTRNFNETWQMPWGEQIDVVNNYKI